MAATSKYTRERPGIPHKRWRWFAGLALLWFVGAAQALPEFFTRDTALDGLTVPVNLVALPDGPLLIAEKGGVIKRFDPDVQPGATTTVVSLANVATAQERGLASIALDPAFTTNGFIYVYYTQIDGGEQFNRISRLTMVDNVANLASEIMLWRDPTPLGSAAAECCHFGGGLDFGPDGLLYLTTGDNFRAPPRSQDLGVADGKIIRLDASQLDTIGPWVPGGANAHIIPADNPFVNTPGALGEIWAYGLRNPFRAHWDLPSGRFLIGDVGGNDEASAREELNLGRAGANYGWNDCEGQCADPAVDDPIFDYGHEGETSNRPGEGGGAIVAGVIYRGGQFPDEFSEVFFYGDYGVDLVKYLEFNADGTITDNDFDTDIGGPVALETGADGALYVADFLNGRLVRYTFNDGNQAPVITSATANPAVGQPPLNVRFSAEATDEEGEALSFEWDFGDGTTATTAVAEHTYTERGLYLARVSVSDGSRTTLSESIEVQVGRPPEITIDFPREGDTFIGGDSVAFSASLANPDEAPPYTYEWTIRFLHLEHFHPANPEERLTEPTGQIEIPTEAHGFEGETGYELIVEVTDATGLRATERVEILPSKVNMSVFSQPAGIDVTYGNDPARPTPLVLDAAANFNYDVSVPQTACIDDTLYNFVAWSDGGDRTHRINTGHYDFSLTAGYEDVGPCTGGTVLNTDGLVAHFEADRGVVNDGGVLQAWNDLSGNGNNLNEVVGDPQFLAAGFNGNAVIDFDGEGDLLQRTAAFTGLPVGASDRTMFMAASYEEAGFGGAGYGTPVDNQTFALVVTPGGQLAVQGWGVTNDFASTVPGLNQGPLIQSAVLANNQLRQFNGGQLIDTRIHEFDTLLGSFVAGAEIDGTPHLDMQIGAILVYDRALSDADRTSVEEYLQAKYLDGQTPPTGGAGPGTPLALNDAGQTSSGTALTLAVLNNDLTGSTLDTGSVSIDQNPAQGSAQVNADGTITYTHNGAPTLQDRFTYTVADANGQRSNPASVSVEIIGADQLPGTTLAANAPESFVLADSGVALSSFDPLRSLFSTSGKLPARGLVAWFGADAGVSADLEGTVLGWSDQSLRSMELVAIGAPQLVASDGSGLPVIEFDGVSDALLSLEPLGEPPVGTDDRSLYAVIRYMGDGEGGVTVGSDDSTESFGLGVGPQGALAMMGDGYRFISDKQGAGAGLLVQAVRLEEGQITHFMDHDKVDEPVYRFNAPERTSEADEPVPQHLLIGADFDLKPFVNMQVAAIVMYDRAVSDSEHARIVDYLRLRHGF